MEAEVLCALQGDGKGERMKGTRFATAPTSGMKHVLALILPVCCRGQREGRIEERGGGRE